MYIDIARVYFYSQTDYIRQTDIKLTSYNGYKSQKFVSLIDAPYFKNVFAPGRLLKEIRYIYLVVHNFSEFMRSTVI
jgi:hypothetical protein